MFDARTDAKHVAQWWGLDDFSNTIHELDVRPGGAWRFVMHDPEGVDYKNEVVVVEVVSKW